MRLALEEARAALSEGNPPFGAVVVRGDQVIVAGHNRVQSECDPTAHGEIVAIRNAASAMRVVALDGTVLYTTCEPCLMCTSAIMWAHISRVVIGARCADAPDYFLHPEKGSLLSMVSYIRYPFEYTVGVLNSECAALYQVE